MYVHIAHTDFKIQIVKVEIFSTFLRIVLKPRDRIRILINENKSIFYLVSIIC